MWSQPLPLRKRVAIHFSSLRGWRIPTRLRAFETIHLPEFDALLLFQIRARSRLFQSNRGGVCLFRCINAQPRKIGAPGHSMFANPEIQRFSRCCNGAQRTNRSRIHNDSKERPWKADHLPQPIESYLLQFRGCRATSPQHPVDVERRREHFAKNTGSGSCDCEICEKSGMVPMRDSGKNDFLEIFHYILKRFRSNGRF